MNVCDERHESKFQVTYKSAPGMRYQPVWLVCESCFENKRHFGSEDMIDFFLEIS